MSALKFICEAASRLISRLECNLIINTQMSQILPSIPSANQNDLDILLMKHRATLLFHDKVMEYLKTMREIAKDACPFKQAISIHIFAMEKADIGFFIEIIQQHQEAIAVTAGISLPEKVNKPEDSIQSVYEFFPFHIILPLLQDQSFFVDLVKVAIAFEEKNFKSSTAKIYKMLEKTPLPHFSKVAVAEILLDYFVADIKKMTKNVSALDNFQFLQNCKLLIKGGYKLLGITEKSMSTFFSKSETDEKAPPRKNPISFSLSEHCKLCFDDDGLQMDMDSIAHVWLEMRRMPAAPSTTTVLTVLSKANNMLRKALAFKDSNIGADEVFQFFVAALVNANILELPSLLSVLSTYIVADLVSPQYSYLKTTLNSAVEFIQTRQVKVPPFLIFPFDSTDNAELKREGKEHVILYRFTVYAYPSYVNVPFKAHLYYTGNQNDCAIGYLFSPAEGMCKSLATIGDRFMTIPTSVGSFFLLDQREIEDGKMIHVNDGDFESRINEVDVVSNIALMIPKRIKSPSTSIIDLLLKEFGESWRLPPPVTKGQVISIIKQLQQALVAKGFKDLAVNGVITNDTIKAIKTIMPGFKKDEFFINPKVFSFIMKTAQ